MQPDPSGLIEVQYTDEPPPAQAEKPATAQKDQPAA
jgi:hypothetical protein